DPGALREFGDQEDDGGERGHYRAATVDKRAVAPVRRPRVPPGHDQTRVGEWEAGEDADGEERDHLVRIPADRDQEPSGQGRQNPDTAVKYLAVTTEAKTVWQVMVAREETGQDWQSAKRRIRGQSEDDRDRQGHDVVRPVTSDGHSHDL